MPVVEGEVIVGKDTVYLETYDDGRLDRLSDRFTAAAPNIPPAHPRTKVIDKESRHQLAMSWRWSMPQGVPEEDVERLNREQMAARHPDVWPETPQPALRAGPRSRPPGPRLRDIPSRRDRSSDIQRGFRGPHRLGTAPRAAGPEAEPAVEAEGLDLDRLHMSRWAMIPFAALDNDRLVFVYLYAERGAAPVMNGPPRHRDRHRPR